MSAEQPRPARLIIVGVGWIVVGAMSAQLALMFILLSTQPGADDFGKTMVAVGASLAAGIALAGILFGIALLRLQRYSRVALEVLTWICCAICLAITCFGIYAFITWPDPSDRWVPLISMLGYPIPLIGFSAILWALRSQKMREAFPLTA